MSHILLIVDTENYSGNFERELCTYVTGQTNEYEEDVSSDDIAHIDWWNAHIRPVKHEEYGMVVTQIWKTEGWFNNGNGSHYRDDGTHEQEAVEASVKSMEAYQAPHIAQAQARINSGDYGEERLGWNKESCERAIEGYKASIDRCRTLTKWPAYMSVAISVDAVPPDDVWKEFQARAKDFCDNHTTGYSIKKPAPLTLTGFRIIQVENKTTYISISQ